MNTEFWNQKPQRAADWELTPDRMVIVLLPKFKSQLLKRWLLPLLSHQHFRIKLDKIGSSFWMLCDGNHTLGEIKLELKNTFYEKIEPIDQRIGKFVDQLYKWQLIKFN